MPIETADRHPLLGAALALHDVHGAATAHAVVIAVFPSNRPDLGDLALIEHHDLFSKEATTRRIVPLADFTDHHWVVFASLEALRAHHASTGLGGG